MNTNQSSVARPRRRAGSGVGAQLLADLRQWVHEQRFALWVTAGFVAINLCWWLFYAVQHKGLPYAELSTTLGAFDLARLLPSLVLTRGVLQLIVEAVLILCVLCVAEPRMGAMRTTLVSLGSAAIGIGGGLLLCAGISTLFGDRALTSQIVFSLSPVTLVAGALMASTAFSYALWRHRVRLIGYTAVLVVILYGGNPGDYCTLIAAVAGQLIGTAIAGRPHESERWHWQYSSSREKRRILGAIGFVLALGPVVTATSRIHAGPLTSLAWIMGPGSVHSSRLAACLNGEASLGCFQQNSFAAGLLPGDVVRSVLCVLVMLTLAWGVMLGRRAAAVASIVFYVLTALTAVVYYLIVPIRSFLAPADGDASTALPPGTLLTCAVNVLVPLIYAIALGVALRNFSVRTHRRTLSLSVTVLIVTLLVCLTVYLVFGFTHAQDFVPHPDARMLFEDLPARLLPAGYLAATSLTFAPATALASVIYQGVGMVFWLVLLVVSLAWLRSSIDYDHAAHEQAETLVEHGGESMSFMATWEGNEYWLSPTGRSAVAYRVLNHIALTTTGPFGDPEEWFSDLDDFSRFCSDHTWAPVFYAVHEEQKDYLQEQGWHSIMVGEEMLIDPQAWKTTGKKWQDVRTAINKAKREGIVDVMTTFDEAPADVQSQIEGISEQWSQGKALPEMKFTLGGVEELKDPRVKILYAIDGDGVVQAVTSWLPTWRGGHVIGWTLDFMRYNHGSYNGIMEFLIARMAQRMHDWGEAHPDEQVRFVSLSAAPLSGLQHSSDATSDDTSNIDGTTVLQHSLALVADLLEPAYGFKSLYRFKLKFQPIQRPVYICYRDSALLPNLAIAIIRAYLPSLTFREALGMLSSFKPKDDAPASADSPSSAPAASSAPSPASAPSD